MTTRIAINGFGRIGREVVRTLSQQRRDLDIVAVNDLTDTRTLAHLLKYDTAYGVLDAELEHDDHSITVNGDTFQVLSEADPAKLPWKELDVDIVIESTGRFRTAEDAGKHIEAGAKRVVLSAPGKGDTPIPTIVPGVNDDTLEGLDSPIVSAASCTTNCLAPLAKVLLDNFGIEHGMMMTAHAYTADQRLQDGPHRDLRRARAAAENIVPTTTGAALAIGAVIPELDGKLTGSAYRVPIVVGSIVDLTVVTRPGLSVEEINAAYRDAADSGKLRGILEYVDEPIVSSDIVQNPHPSIFDAGLTTVNGSLVKVSAWYDNEWGYTQQLLSLTERLAAK